MLRIAEATEGTGPALDLRASTAPVSRHSRQVKACLHSARPASRSETTKGHISTVWGDCHSQTRGVDVLADPEVNVVHINSPIPDHAPMSIAALQAGKHVLCTVPMATSLEECWQIVELVPGIKG